MIEIILQITLIILKTSTKWIIYLKHMFKIYSRSSKIIFFKTLDETEKNNVIKNVPDLHGFTSK